MASKLTKRIRSVACAIGTTQIVLMGGSVEGGRMLDDVILIDARDDRLRVKKVYEDEELDFLCTGVAVKMSGATVMCAVTNS